MSSAPEPANEGSGSLTGRVVACVLIVLFLYLLPFLLIFLDEFVFKTFWFNKHLPAGAGAVFRALYPFYKLIPP